MVCCQQKTQKFISTPNFCITRSPNKIIIMIIPCGHSNHKCNGNCNRNFELVEESITKCKGRVDTNLFKSSCFASCFARIIIVVKIKDSTSNLRTIRFIHPHGFLHRHEANTV